MIRLEARHPAKLDKIVEYLSANVSHEINSPSAAMRHMIDDFKIPVSQ